MSEEEPRSPPTTLPQIQSESPKTQVVLTEDGRKVRMSLADVEEATGAKDGGDKGEPKEFKLSKRLQGFVDRT
jgi:hypothetical protein